ncbi:amino acid permease [Listeria newyorkensis]|uniref:Amino acid permease n=1 Tax=Listeria newyorkensis TaxID=1497681 RepID=A0ABX4XRM4_9LIST|nr:amino acid permease [Listeria newyorkensis]KGL43797.1 amino acid permease [Listeria newyorkensis]KMT61692.1 amino acid permease-associated protein [Listeria newyorkensis]PNP95066.1 amino acid permease [Listeria newyorkensis]WAO21999.1 amino acid permease [Listeria newyorkensis]SQC59053.1 Serine/threonine exchanger SteT [Listeria newyorkensis]
MENQKLKKEIGFFTALTIVMGTVIGSGVFFKPEAVYSATGTASLGLLAWILGGVITICGGLTAAELSAAIPQTGGMMMYLQKTYGKLTAYLLGWAQTVIYFPANIAALSIIFATQVANLFGTGDGIIVPVAIAAAAFIMLMNFIGAKVAGSFQAVTTICKLVPLILIIIFGLFHQGDVAFRLFPISVEDHPFLTSLGSGLVATMFAYDGWIHVGNIAGEMKNPKKDLPKAIVFGLTGVMLVYLLINIAYLFVMPAAALAATATPASDVANIIFGSIGGKLITVGILISVFGTINGYTMTGIRIPYAMALDNQLPFSNWFKKLGAKSSVPYNGGIVILIISIIMIFSGGFNQLTDMLIFVIWIFYTLTFIAVFVLRKREPELVRPYKVPLYPVIPIIAILGGAFIVLNTLFTQPMNAGIGLVLTAIGLPIYLYKKKKGHFSE